MPHLKVIQRFLDVALEHLEPDGHSLPPPRDTLEQGQLHAVCVRIVVLLADEDDVGLPDIREHHLEVRELTMRGIEDAFRHVGGLCRDGGREDDAQGECAHGEW